MKLQESWVLQIQPQEALLKFRLPYGKDHTAFEDCPNVDYLDGVVYVQPFTGSTSTETRLVPRYSTSDSKETKEKKYDTCQWSIYKYENQMFRHNVTDRQTRSFRNPLIPNDKQEQMQYSPIDPPELLNDHDSVYECVLIQEYIAKINGMSNEQNVRKFSRLFTKALSSKKTLALLRHVKFEAQRS